MKYLTSHRLNRFNMHLVQFWEWCQQNGLWPALKNLFYRNREAALLKKELTPSALKQRRVSPPGIKLVEFSEANFPKMNLIYPLRYRYLRASLNIADGYRSFAILRENEVLADLWYAASTYSKKPCIHPNLELFGLQLGAKDVWATDDYTKPQERGKGLMTLLWHYAYESLREKGFDRVYGWTWLDNKPSVIFHTKVGLKQFKRIRMNRFLLYQRRVEP